MGSNAHKEKKASEKKSIKEIRQKLDFLKQSNYERTLIQSKTKSNFNL